MKNRYQNPDNDPNGPWVLTEITMNGEREGRRFEWNGKSPPSGRSWRFNEAQARELESQGRIVFSSTGMPCMKRYLTQSRETLLRVLEQLPHHARMSESEFTRKAIPALISALGYSDDETFFDYGRGKRRADLVVSNSIESKPWVIFEVKSGRTQDISSWIQQLHDYLTEFGGTRGVVVSPEILVVIDRGVVKQFDLNNLAITEAEEILKNLERADQDVPNSGTRIRNIQLIKLIEEAESAKTNDAKGKSFEALGRHLFSCIPSLRCKYSNLNTRSSEIDIVVEYNSSNGVLPLFEELGRYCFVECKNWSAPVGAKHIRDFIGKLEKCRVKLGVILAKNGVTGENSGLDAIREVQSAFDRDGPIILIFSLEDLRTIEDGGAFTEALDLRFDYLRFDIEG
ncbi:restriction endonuclease [Duganella aceris]|uniref:Restriction endonuclease n=1 Tax=Duganella aceris TaxID=2703883 RepID=A0ABX0FVX5_9BURK|nr:restriction endonuclease [Duganella aceris]NGZ88604.1 restriction endonuclease [Duganella aceris]